MSHFAVLVIGPNVEEQLAPYHEYECTGVLDQYVKAVDVTEEYRSDWQKYGKGCSFAEYVEGEGKPLREDNSDDDSDYPWGWYRVKDGEVTEVIRRTNPDAKWDWWMIGGRYSGRLQIKGKRGIPQHVDQALVRDIDFEGMHAQRAREAAEHWDKAAAVIKGRSFKRWEEVLAVYGEAIDLAREYYGTQPVIRDWRANEELRWWNIEDYTGPRELYIKQAVESTLVMFAVVKDGKWYQRGEMGWFACVSNEKSREEWDSEVSKLLNGLPGDTMLTVVDCHI